MSRFPELLSKSMKFCKKQTTRERSDEQFLQSFTRINGGRQNKKFL